MFSQRKLSVPMVFTLPALVAIPFAMIVWGPPSSRNPANEISTDQLAQLMRITPQSDASVFSTQNTDDTDTQRANRSADYVLVDVRDPAEIDVSIIPGAITRDQFETQAERFRDRTVIVYCTIGYRSGKYAKRLRARGFRAKNYKPSILGWAAAGLPVVTPEGNPTLRVHTYSKRYKVAKPYQGVTGR